MRIGRKVVRRLGKHVGEVTTPATGHQDFLADLISMVEHQYLTATLASSNGTHQASGSSTDNNNINLGGKWGQNELQSYKNE